MHSSDTGESWPITRVTIDNPNPGVGETATVQQGLAQDGTSITRGEGAWFGSDMAYFISTSDGPAGPGITFAITGPWRRGSL